MKIYPQFLAACLFVIGCGGRNTAPQKSEPIVVTKEIAVPGKDRIDTFYIEVPVETVYGSDVPTVDNPCPERVVYKIKRVKVKGSNNNTAKNSNQVVNSKVDSSTLQADTKKTTTNAPVKQKDVGNVKKSGNTKETNNWWVWFLLGAATWQLARIGLKRIPVFGKVFQFLA